MAQIIGLQNAGQATETKLAPITNNQELWEHQLEEE